MSHSFELVFPSRFLNVFVLPVQGQHKNRKTLYSVALKLWWWLWTHKKEIWNQVVDRHVMSNFKLAISLRAIKSQWTLTVNNVASLGIVMVGYRETETLIENFLSDLWFFFFFFLLRHVTRILTHIVKAKVLIFP